MAAVGAPERLASPPGRLAAHGLTSIASFSLHGWVWFALAFLGSRLGVKLRSVRRVGLGGLSRFRDHRPTWATLQIKAGTPGRMVPEPLGHSSVTVTLAVYPHVLPE